MHVYENSLKLIKISGEWGEKRYYSNMCDHANEEKKLCVAVWPGMLYLYTYKS